MLQLSDYPIASSPLASLLSERECEILHEVEDITLDYSSLQRDMECFVAPSCVVVGYGELCDEFIELCIHGQQELELSLTHLLPQDFVRLSGSLGDFELTYRAQDGALAKLCCAQVVSFAPLQGLRSYKGVHRADEYESAQDLLSALLALCGQHSFVRNIIFEPKGCQYHARRKGANGELYCHACVDVCPTLGVSSDNASMLLALSPIDCIACGKCVSVCPTGSLQREGDTLEALTLKARLYQGFIPLIVARQVLAGEGLGAFMAQLEALRCIHPKILPLILEVPNMLNFTTLLTLIQESGAPILLHAPLENHADVDSLNELCLRVYRLRGVVLLDEAAEIAQLGEIPHFAYTPSAGEGSKEIAAARLAFVVKLGDYGRLELGGYGLLGIESQACTLCMSCVEACNTGALLHHQSRFELLYKPALCTDCGYCVSSCAEQILSLESRTLPLAPQSFEYTSIASDEPFRCVECQKIFATKKSIEKIKGILSPAFGGDTLKLKSLECCADCKVKIMFEGERA